MLTRHLVETRWLLAAILVAALVGGSPGQSPSPSPPTPLPKGEGRRDVSGDPLPEGAIARMGTLRWRHAEAVNFVAYANQDQVVTAAADNVIRVWQRNSGKEIRRIALSAPVQMVGGRPGVVPNWDVLGRRLNRVTISDDGKTVAAVLINSEIQLWSVATGNEMHRIKPPTAGVNSITFAPDGKSLAVRLNDRSIAILKIKDGAEIARIKGLQLNFGPGIAIGGGGSTEASGTAFSRDGKVIATAELEVKMQKFNSFIRFSDAKTGTEIRRIEPPNGTSALAYSPGKKTFAYASGNGVYLVAADDGKEIVTIKAPIASSAVLFTPDGKGLAVKGRDQVIRLFDAKTGDKLRDFGDSALQGNVNVVGFGGFGGIETRDFAFSPDGKVLTVAAGPTLRFWNVGTGKEQPMAGGHRAGVTTVRLTPDGKTLLTRGLDQTIRRWDASSGKELAQFAEPKGTIACIFSPDAQVIALPNANGSIHLYSADGKELHQLKGHQNGATGLAFSADSKLLATRGGFDRNVKIFDVAKGVEIAQLTFSSNEAANPQNPRGFQGVQGQALAFSADGKTLAANANTASYVRDPNGAMRPTSTSTIHLWNLDLRKEVRRIPMPIGRAVGALAFAPDGRLLASENLDQTVSLIELASGKEAAVLGQAIAAVQPTGNGGFIAIGGGMIGRNARIQTSLAFSRDGGLLVARGPGHSVAVWDVDHAKQVGTFKGHSAELLSVSIALDGKTLASGSSDTTALVWDLTRAARAPKAATIALDAKEIDGLWIDLVGADAAKARASLFRLASGAKETVAFMGERLKPASPVDAKALAGWITDLNSNNFTTRSKALVQLDKLGDLALPALKQALDSNVPLETRRRIEPLVDKLTTGTLTAEQIRTVRAMQVLERLGTPEARKLLDTLAQGAAGAQITREAQKALANLVGQR